MNLLQSHELLCALLSVVLNAKLKPLKALSLLTSTYYFTMYVENSTEPLTLVFLTGSLCCVDPADIPAEDGPTVDQDTLGGH